jgi:peptidoglycan/xylan/chitin deacetylase (PgdA/CDA1 family)
MTKRTGTVLALMSAALFASATSADAAQCGDNPQALGTSRVLTVNPRTFPMVGRTQYRESLPLGKREVVLTFDNGPSYPYTDTVLKALATECVKATFFALGSSAEEDPEQLRRIALEGHTTGVQTYNHVSLATLSVADARIEIDNGIKAVSTALQVSQRAIPLFRAPMLDLPPPVARYVVSLGMMVWSIDVDSRDWNDGISEEQIVEGTIKGLERSGGGIVAMQDVQPTTARALPQLLQQLKQRNFKIVHVVPNQPQARANTGKAARP